MLFVVLLVVVPVAMALALAVVADRQDRRNGRPTRGAAAMRRKEARRRRRDARAMGAGRLRPDRS